MIIEQKHWSNSEWKETLSSSKDVDANLVLVFGGRHQLSDGRRFEEIKEQYPNANILVGSTSGEILDTEVHDDTLVLTAIQFEKTTIEVAKLTQSEIDDSFSGGEVLAK